MPSKTYTGQLNGKGQKHAIIVSRFNELLTSKLLEGAQDCLVRHGVAFRDAHGIVGRLVRHAIEEGKSLSELSLDEYRRFSPHFGDDVFDITAATSVAARNLAGGTAPEQVARAIAEARRRLEGQS